jgi:hypothetical protein
MSAISAASFRCTAGLQKKYGKTRCFDTPISELGIVGAAVGMAAYGLKPCVEIQFADYMYPAYDQIVSEAARLRYRSAGEFTCPIVRAHARPAAASTAADPQPEPRGAVHSCGRTQDHDPLDPGRRQGPAAGRHRGSRSGDLPRTQAALQRPLRRPPRPAGRFVEEDRSGRGARRSLHDATRQGRAPPGGQGHQRHNLWHNGPCRAGGRRGDRDRRRYRRPQDAAAARSGCHRAVGPKDRAAA